MKKNRRGSHVGIAISFLIFVVFLAFFYSALKPATEVQDKQLMLDYLKSVLIEEMSSNLTTITINSSGGNCLNISYVDISSADFGVTSGAHAIVKNETGNIMKSKRIGNELLIESPGNKFFWIYYSEEKFAENPTVISSCQFNPTIKSTLTGKYVFANKIAWLKDKRYEESYVGLKNELNIPSTIEFDFSFTFSDGSVIKTEKNASVNIYADETHVQYVDEEANILPGVLKIRVW